MIGFLRGKVLFKTAERVVLDVSGVGYEIEVPASSLCELPGIGCETAIYIYTHVREDAIRLFGFANPTDKSVFDALISVSGIGPKSALALLGATTGSELISLISHGHVARLTAIPGIGSKTAERLILELKTKLPKLLCAKEESLFTSKTPPLASSHLIEDLKSALTNLGYKPKQFQHIIADLDKKQSGGEPLSLEGALKDSLKKLTEHVLKHGHLS
jgi:Holliday junction DNA helicase RuvA